MDEDVAIPRVDEAKPSGLVEPFNLAIHVEILLV
jgi:hypothetical protein